MPLIFFFLFLFSFSILTSSAQLFKLATTLKDNNPPATVLKIKPGGASLVEGDEGGNLILRNIDNGNIQKNIPSHSASINHIDFNSTGRLVVSSSVNGEIRVYDFIRERTLHRYKAETTNMRFALFSIADGFVYYNTNDKLWKIRSDFNREAENVHISPQPITSAVITPDRNALIFSSGNYVNVLSTRSDVIVQQLYVGDAVVQRLHLLPDNSLMTWSEDGTVNIWNVALGQIVNPAAKFFKAGKPANASFSNDGRWMVTANAGTWARIWNLKDKTIAQELFDHTSAIPDFAFSADAGTLFTSSKDLTFKVWKQKLDSVPAPAVVEKEIPMPVMATPKQEPPPPKDVVMASHDIPAQIMGRTVKKTQTIKTSKSTLDIYVYDNGIIDGDTLSLFFNGNWLLKNFGVNKTKKKITLKFNQNSNNYLVLFAENLGRKPPNTAVIEYSDENGNHIVRLSSDLSLCSAVNFVY
jgi:WD40 repeat protein